MTITPEQLMGPLSERLEALSSIGRIPEVGLWRRSFTSDEGVCMDLVAGWLRAAGLTAHRDAAGNLTGRLEGKEPSLPVIAAGSHLDSVKNGGNYDGPLGTLAAAVAVEHLYRTYGQPRRTVEVVGFTGEEGSRFPGGFIGSLAAVGRLDGTELSKVDEDGTTLAEAMMQAGFDPAGLPNAVRKDWGAWLELHVEQGRVLESRGIDLGLVYAIVGLKQIRLTVTGRPDHAGTTPMDLRHDAMRAAAEMISSASALVEEAGPPGVLTTGKLQVKPGATNIVAREVEFTFDFRDADPARRSRNAEAIRTCCEEIALRRRVGLKWEVLLDTEPTPCDEELLAVLRRSAEGLGLSTCRMVSGAGHDAMVLASICPVAMLFVPSKDGRSHTPDEYTSPIDCARGAAVLATALYALAWEESAC